MAVVARGPADVRHVAARSVVALAGCCAIIGYGADAGVRSRAAAADRRSAKIGPQPARRIPRSCGALARGLGLSEGAR
jgi:hypothetical protein